VAGLEDAAWRFDVEGQEVQCFLSGKHRLWHCGCDRFQRNLTRFREGFCPHVVVAIERAYAEGKLDPASVFSEISGDPQTFR
jgi:hypothetical protein